MDPGIAAIIAALIGAAASIAAALIAVRTKAALPVDAPDSALPPTFGLKSIQQPSRLVKAFPLLMAWVFVISLYGLSGFSGFILLCAIYGTSLIHKPIIITSAVLGVVFVSSAFVTNWGAKRHSAPRSTCDSNASELPPVARWAGVIFLYGLSVLSGTLCLYAFATAPDPSYRNDLIIIPGVLGAVSVLCAFIANWGRRRLQSGRRPVDRTKTAVLSSWP